MELIIDTDQLRKIFAAITARLDEEELKSVALPWDYYWDIPAEERYNPYEDPANPNMGQLTDDWSDLLKILHGHMPPTGYSLVCLSSILLALGEAIQLPAGSTGGAPEKPR